MAENVDFPVPVSSDKAVSWTFLSYYREKHCFLVTYGNSIMVMDLLRKTTHDD